MRRLFYVERMDFGEVMASLLRATLPDIQDEALMRYVQALLRTFEHKHGSLNKVPAPSESLIEPLTPREQEVLHLLADGASNQEIATQLVVSLATAKKHVANILSKLGAENRTQAIARARTFSLL
jgi:LuxR family transcriptional regulator, maltose regulon positive regulatory protein